MMKFNHEKKFKGAENFYFFNLETKDTGIFMIMIIVYTFIYKWYIYSV